jgi:hypothetical protein
LITNSEGRLAIFQRDRCFVSNAAEQHFQDRGHYDGAQAGILAVVLACGIVLAGPQDKESSSVRVPSIMASLATIIFLEIGQNVDQARIVGKVSVTE